MNSFLPNSSYMALKTFKSDALVLSLLTHMYYWAFIFSTKIDHGQSLEAVIP